MKRFSAFKLCLMAFVFAFCPFFLNAKDTVMVYENGAKAIGWVEDGRLNGVGALLTEYNDSLVDECYMGAWNDGEKHGNGMELSNRATVITIVNRMFGERNGRGEIYTLAGDSIIIEICKWSADTIVEHIESFKIANKMRWTRFPLRTKKIVCDNNRGFVGERFYGMGINIWYDDNFSAGYYMDDNLCVLGSSKSYFERYVGEWLDNNRSGRGVLLLENGEVYKGNFVYGDMSGNGLFVWPNGDKYVGGFVYSQKEGYGVLTTSEGRYEGVFAGDKLSGYGVFVSGDGDRYEGNFAKGVRSGYGVMYFKNGDVYKGFWKKGDEDGYGMFLSHDGTVKYGYWKKGSFYSETREPKERRSYSWYVVHR